MPAIQVLVQPLEGCEDLRVHLILLGGVWADPSQNQLAREQTH